MVCEFKEFNKLMAKKFKILKKAIKDEMEKPKEKQNWDKVEKKMEDLGVLSKCAKNIKSQ